MVWEGMELKSNAISTNTPNLKSDKILDFSNRLEGYLSGKSLEKI